MLRRVLPTVLLVGVAACDRAATPLEPEADPEAAGKLSVTATVEECYWRCAWSLAPQVGRFTPVAMNEDAHIVGQRPDSTFHFWNREKGSWTAIPKPNSRSRVNDINNWGQAVGGTFVGHSPMPIPVVWEPDGSHYIVPLPGGWNPATAGEAHAVSEGSYVVGKIQIDGAYRAFIYHWGSGTRLLGTLKGNSSIAFDVNERGQVAGVSQIANSMQNHAFRWTSSGGMQDLGVLPGEISSWGTHINEDGWVVGDSGSRAFLWTPERGMRDLFAGQSDIKNPGPCRPRGINDYGEVVGLCEASPSTTVRGEARRGKIAWFWREESGIVALVLPPNSALLDVVGVNNWGDIIVSVGTWLDGTHMHSVSLLTWKGNEYRYGV